MAKRNIDSNSGVQANVGFDFQRHTCIYVFLDKYHEIKNQEYFIFLEHYDDIVFGFLNSNGELSQVSTYQAKKSSTVWTTNQVYEIIQKICNSGIEILKDDHKKSFDYILTQHFITNNTIALDYKCSEEKKKKKIYVNESDDSVPYKNLDKDCQQALKKGNKTISFDTEQINHFDYLNFTYIDFGRNSKSQLEQLRGKFETVFGRYIIDHSAARDTLIHHLKQIESTYNQGDIPRLNDKSKRLESSQIESIFNVLTTNKLAMDFCRRKASDICQDLKINVLDAMSFELTFENSLDEFKDLSQGEHQKIIRFIEGKKSIFTNYTDDVACIKDLFDCFLNDQNTTLNTLQLTAAMSAGYFLTLMKNENISYN